MTTLPWSQHPAAGAELREAAIWYDDCRPGLGDDLAQKVTTGLTFIRTWPEAAPLYPGRRLNPQVRTKSIDTFPYRTIYFVRDGQVIVVAYAHAKRRPGYWRQRLDDLRSAA